MTERLAAAVIIGYWIILSSVKKMWTPSRKLST